MAGSKAIHPDFGYFLNFKDKNLINLFCDLRSFMLELDPAANELLYHTHALTTVFSLSEKLSDSYCMIPIYNNHLNLGFNKGTLLKDPQQLLTGTGNLIRHIPVKHPDNYRNEAVKALISEAIALVVNDMEKPAKLAGQTISKIKRK